MELTVQFPDEILTELGDTTNVPRQLLEAFAVERYRARKLSRAQVGRLLGLDYWETESFLGHHDALRPYTLADLEIDRQSLAKVLPTK